MAQYASMVYVAEAVTDCDRLLRTSLIDKQNLKAGPATDHKL